jgi:dihydrodipicolinate synthase/N-acetylneuraminate lyase
MISHPPRGLLADLVTPLGGRGTLDTKSLNNLIGFLSRYVDGFLAGSLVVGEGLSLDRSIRLGILRAALNALPDDKSLFFDVTGQSSTETGDLIREAERILGTGPKSANVFLMMTPLAFHGNRDLPNAVRDLCLLSRRRFVLANDPYLAGRLRTRLRHRNIRTAVLKKMAANEQIAGLAHTGELSRVLNYQRALKNRTGFRFYDSDEANFLERPSSSGLISAGANLVPRHWADIVGTSLNLFDAHRQYPDHLSRLWQSGQTVRGFMDLYETAAPAALKFGLQVMGVLASGQTTDPTAEIPSDVKSAMEKQLDALKP